MPKSVMCGNELTVYLSGDIDHHSARKIREATDALIQQNQPSVLKLNFGGVNFMDSSGIGLIMGRYRMMLLYGGSVKVVNVPENLRRIMELSGLSGLNVFERSGEFCESVK